MHLAVKDRTLLCVTNSKESLLARVTITRHTTTTTKKQHKNKNATMLVGERINKWVDNLTNEWFFIRQQSNAIFSMNKGYFMSPFSELKYSSALNKIRFGPFYVIFSYSKYALRFMKQIFFNQNSIWIKNNAMEFENQWNLKTKKNYT